jgi:hypothetical protein
VREQRREEGIGRGREGRRGGDGRRERRGEEGRGEEGKDESEKERRRLSTCILDVATNQHTHTRTQTYAHTRTYLPIQLHLHRQTQTLTHTKAWRLLDIHYLTVRSSRLTYRHYGIPGIIDTLKPLHKQ